MAGRPAYLVVLKGWVVRGPRGRHLHGRRLGGLGVQMPRPLEEDKTKAGEARKPHDSSSRRYQRWDRGSGRRQRPQHSPRPSSWEGPVASERCREGLAPRVQRPQDKQGLCSPFLRRVPVIQVVGDTCKVVRQSSGHY